MSPVRYGLGVYVSEDEILRSHHREAVISNRRTLRRIASNLTIWRNMLENYDWLVWTGLIWLILPAR
jgi:hypothetical protein